MAFGLGAGVYFAADSNSGSIYRLIREQARRGLSGRGLWTTAAVRIGINGVKVRKDWVYFRTAMGIQHPGLRRKPQGTPVKIEWPVRR
jgi:hypothetical protein